MDAKPTILRMREGKPGGGKGPLLSENLSLTLTTSPTDVLFLPSPSHPGSAEPGASTSGSNEPDGASYPTARSSPTPAPSSTSGGLELSIWATSPTFETSPQPPSGQGDRPARTSRSRADGPGSPDPEADSPSDGLSWLEHTDHERSFSRTSPESSPAMMVWTGTPSFVRWQTSGLGSPGGFWMHSGSDCPSDESGCGCSAYSTLADILTPTAPERYSLSPVSAAGIIERTGRRLMRLPRELAAALESVVAGTQESSPYRVRRLTPLEGERLQGWPDGHTIVHGWRSPKRAGRPTPTPQSHGSGDPS